MKNFEKIIFLLFCLKVCLCFHSDNIEHTEDTPSIHHAPQSHIIVQYCLSCNTHLNGDIAIFISEDAPRYPKKALRLDPNGTSTPILKVIDSYGNPTRTFDLSTLSLKELRTIISNYGIEPEKPLFSKERINLNQKSKNMGNDDTVEMDTELHIEPQNIVMDEPKHHEVDPVVTEHE